MAAVIDWLRKAVAIPLGQAVKILIYALMLLAVLMFFSGNGEFIYEAF